MKRRRIGLIILIAFTFIVGITGYKNATKQHAKAIKEPDHNLVFDSNRTGNYEIFTVETTGEISQLTNSAAYDSWWPKASPDAKKIIFYRTPEGVHDKDYTKTSLWKMNLDGSDQQQLIADNGYGWALHGHAEWSPDGKKLLMFGEDGQLFTTDTAGKNLSKIGVNGQTSGITDPAWSPDGKTIVYAYQNKIWRVSASGGNPTQLTAGDNKDYDPYFSPDGDQIAFLTHTSSNILGDWAIRVMSANGASIKYLINDGNINSKPEWSPDGKSIYFHRHPSGAGSGYFGLWFMGSDGTDLTALDVGKGSNEYPDIMPAAKISKTKDVATSKATSSSTPSQNTATPSQSAQSSGASAQTATKSQTNIRGKDEINQTKSDAVAAKPKKPQKQWKALLLLLPPLAIIAIIIYRKVHFL